MLDMQTLIEVPVWSALGLFVLGLALGRLSYRDRAEAAITEATIELVQQYEHESRAPMTAERVRFWNDALEHALRRVKKS